MIEIELAMMLWLLPLLALAVYALVWFATRKIAREWQWWEGYGP